jgi:DNA-binding transcriptional LysR family regulator
MRRKINFRQIEAFHAVMLTGTATQAAPLLGVTQPAVSRLISELEAQVGMSLFVRGQGRLKPTPEAESLFNEIERAYVGLDHITSFIQGMRRSGGHLRLIATMPMAHGILPEAIARFRRTHSETVVVLKTVIRRDIQTWLDAQQFDIALTNFPVDYPSAATERLACANGVCVMPSAHPLVEKDIIHAADVAEEPFIAMAAETQHRLKVDRAFAEAGVQPNIIIEAQTGVIICELVAAGLGVSVVDPITARVVQKGLVSRPFLPAVQYEFRLLYPTQRARSRDTIRFSQIVTALVRELGFGG